MFVVVFLGGFRMKKMANFESLRVVSTLNLNELPQNQNVPDFLFRIFVFRIVAPPTHTLRQRSENFEFRKKTFRSPITISDHVIVVSCDQKLYDLENFKTLYFEMGQ